MEHRVNDDPSHFEYRPKSTRWTRGSFALVFLSILGACADAQTPEDEPTGPDVLAQATGVTRAQAGSVLYRASLKPQRPLVSGTTDDLATYATKCDEATGITVPDFNCDEGSEVPGQGTIPATDRDATRCDRPNALNGHCDPGSRFQVLRGSTADAVAVAHCRKVGLPVEGSKYNDIAVIQYNKRNGATCFYQALTNLDGSNVPAPRKNNWVWWTPTKTQGVGCTGCHDTGGFIRSSYLAQALKPATSGWNKGKAFALPNQNTGFDNRTLVRYVGSDYAGDTSYAITLKGGSPCTSCHNLAVNKSTRPRSNASPTEGTANWLAEIATRETQDSRLLSAPPWMPPGTTKYNGAMHDLALRYAKCGAEFLKSGNRNQDDCTITDLAKPYP